MTAVRGRGGGYIIRRLSNEGAINCFRRGLSNRGGYLIGGLSTGFYGKGISMNNVLFTIPSAKNAYFIVCKINPPNRFKRFSHVEILVENSPILAGSISQGIIEKECLFCVYKPPPFL